MQPNPSTIVLPNLRFPASSRVCSRWPGAALGFALAVCALNAPPASAQSLYWDSNADTAGAGAAPAGVWGTDSYWSTDPLGLVIPGAWVSGNDAIFSAGTDAAGAYTVTLSGAQTAGSLSFEEGNVTLSGATPLTNLIWSGQVNVASGASAALNVLMSGSGGLTKSGAGLLALGNTNDFTGPVNVTAGTLAFGNSANAADTYLGAIPGAFNQSAVTLQDSTTLRLNAAIVTFAANRGLTIAGSGANLDANAGAILFIPNVVQGPGATVTKIGAGEVGFYGAANTFARLVIDQGNLRIGQAAFPGSDLSYGAVPSVFTPDAITIRNGATNRVVGNAAVTISANRGITLGAGGGVFRNDVSPVSLTINSAITGPGGLRKEGGQAFTINGDRSYEGPTVINGGGISLTAPQNTFNGLGTGTGPLVMNSGRLLLNHANAYSSVAVAGGRIDVNTNGCLGTGTVTISPTNNVTVVNATTLGVGPVTNVTLNNDFVINVGATLAGAGVIVDIAANSGRELILNGKVSGDAHWKKDNAGTGTLVLANPANDFTGVLTNFGGTLMAAVDNALGATSGGTHINSGGSLAFRGGITYSAAEPITMSGLGRFTGGAISNESGNNSFAGPITMIGDGSVGGMAETTLTLNGAIGETGGARLLYKLGAGTVTLAASAGNTYSGGTIISNGVLVAANSTGSATGPGPITIYSPGALTGPGSVAGTLTVNGILSPGASPGTLNTGSEIWNGGGSYVWEINDADAGLGTDPGWDLLNITGTLTINATSGDKFNIDITSLTPANAAGNVHDFDNSTDYTWTILKTTGGITGFDAAAFNVLASNFSNPLGAGSFLIETANAGNDLVIRFVRAPVIAVQPVNQSAECATGSATFTVGATGTAPITYQWRRNGVDIGGATLATLTINPTTTATAGSYDVVVANPYGTVTSAAATLTLVDTTVPVITACAPNQTLSANANCQAAVPDLTGLVVAGDTCGPVTVSQTPTAGTLVGVGANVVTITVTDSANLTATCTATVTVNDATPPTITACAANQSVTATLAGCMAAIPDLTGQVMPTDNCAGAITVTQSPVAGTLAGVGPTTVTLTATDAAGNPATCQAIVTVTSGVTATVNSATICSGGSATLTATTAAANPSYLWSPGGATTASIMVSPAETTVYTVTVTDGVTGCTGGGSGTVTLAPGLVVAVNSAAICTGGSATLTATNEAVAPTYLWSPGGATTASITVSPTDTTVYMVTVTDGAGCTGSASGTVTVNPLPNVSVNSPTICAGAPTILTATTAAANPSYLWSPGGETTASITVSPTVMTTYSVTVTDGVTTCANSASGTVTITPLPTVSVNSETICSGGSATLTATTAAANPTYLWSPGGATTAAITVSPTATTVYTVTVTDGTTTCANSASGTVTVNPLPAVTVNSPSICPGDSATLTATTSAANPAYLWSPGGETTASITVTPASTTTYSVTVTDGVTGCVGSGSGTVTVRAPEVFANSGPIAINDFAAASPYPSVINVSGLTATVCRVTVTLNNLSHPFPDDIDIVLIAPNGQGVLLMSDVGGANPASGITLTLDDSAAGSLPDNSALASGTFKPTNIGAKSDNRPDNFPAPVPAVNFVTNLSVLAGINPNGAWSLYVFDDELVDVGSMGGGWSVALTTLTPIADLAVAQTPIPNPVGVGSNLTFNVTVSNLGPAGADGVSLTDTLPAGMTFVSATPSQGSCGESLGVVTCALGSIAANGSATVAIVVIPTAVGAGNNLATVTAPTLDLVTANNSSSAGVTVLDPPVITVPPVNQVVCADHSASFSVTATGAAPLSYQWYLNDVAIGGATASSHSIASAQAGDAGTYKVIVSNPVGAAQTSATLTVNPLPTVTVSSETICVGQSATLTATTSAANPGYLWSPGGATTASITVSPASTTIYSVLVTDGVTGCTNSASGTVTVKALTTATALTSVANLCPGSPVSFSTTASGDGPFTYVWRKDGSLLGETSSTLSIASVTSADAGTYSVEVTGFCNSVTNSATLTVAAPPTIAAQPQNQTTPMGNSATFSVTANGVGPITYQWRLNGADISGATASSLTVQNVTLAQNGESYSVLASNCAGTILSAAAILTVTPITGISFDFNTPGQYSNAPFNLKSNNWMSSAIVNGLNNPLIPVIPFEVPAFDVTAAPGSGALDLAFNNGTDHGNTLLPVNYDFSLHGKTLVASIMMKIKVPTANQRATQIGFVTTTNVNNAWQQINANNGQGFMSAIMQSTIQPAPGYMLRAQFKPIAGTTATETQPINNPTNLLATNNWYRLVAKFVNIKDTVANTYTVEASLQDMGANGQTPGAVVLAYPPQNQANADLVNARNLFFCIRGFENGGIDFWDNVYINTTNGPVFIVQPPQSQTVAQGRQVALRALVDGDGPYTYQWNKNGTPIPGAGSWNYTTPPLLLSDSGAEYTVTVTSPNNTITSAPAVITVQPDALNVVSVGSVEGSSIGLRFDQPVDKTSAEVGANYLVNGVAAWGASVRDSGSDVLITPAAPITGPFTVVVQNVLSLSGTAIGVGNAASGTVAGLTGYDINPLSVGANGQVSTIPGENHSFAPGAFDIKGGGHDIFGNFDGFRFVYQQRTGDFDVKVRVPYQDLLRTPNKAGFAVRPSLDAFGPSVFAGVNPMLPGRNIYEGTVRQAYNVATTSWGAGTVCTYPNTWLRFRRVGNTFIRYSSSNGATWQCDGQTSPSPAFPETVYFGFAVCANVGTANLQQMIRAEFDNYGDFGGYAGAEITSVAVSPLAPTVVAGNSTNLTATVTTANLPASAGELSYVWQRENGSGGWTNLIVAGATNNILNTGPLSAGDNGAQFRVIVSAPGALSVTSAVAVVTVTDTVAPTVAASVFPTNSLNQLLVTFNELVSAATALNPANYTVTNGAGTVFPVASVVFLGSDQRVVLITTVDTLPAGTYGVRITGVQDLGGNTIAATTRTFSQQPSPALAPIVVDIYTGLHNAGADILTLTTNIMFVNDTPSFTVYSNVFGINPLNANFPDTLNNYGVRMYTWFVPPTSGAYKFYVRADDFAEFYLNTNAVDSTTRAGATLQLALTANRQFYTNLAGANVTNTLVGGQRYYMELRFKETGGGDGGTVAVRTDNTIPGQGEVIPGNQCVFPDTIAPRTPAIVELYTGQVTVNSLAVNDLGAAFGSGGYPDLLASAKTINFIAGLPNVIGYEKSFAFKQDLREAQASFDNYMGRMYSLFVAPSNGLYRFYIRHDDSGELWMNTNATDSANPAGISLLGFVNDFYDVNYRVAAQNVSLTAGQRYYIEGRWREGGGGDGMTVAVRAQQDFFLPPTSESIPGSLLEFPTNLARIGPVSLAGISPANPTVNEGQSITFIANGVSGTGPYGFVWLKNGQQVHANAAFYVTPPLTSADNGAVFSLMVTNIFGTVTRSSTVSIVTDTTAPSIVSAMASSYGDTILVTFDEPVEPLSAQCLANYRINGLAVLGADWDEINRNRVSLRTSPQAANTTYTLVINGVRDHSTAGNAIVNGTATVSTWVAGGQGAVLVEVFTNIPNTSVDWLFADPRFANNMADISYYTNQFSFGLFGADTGMNNYGVRVSGVFFAPSNGLYRFFVRGDDGTRLFMNTNGPSPAGRVLIARNDGANSASNLVVTPQLSAYQTGIGLGTLGASISPIISLAGGGGYYLEALMKEGGGGDHLEVVVRAIDPNTLTEIGGLPFNAAVTDAIPGSFFGAPGNPDANKLVILQSPPANLTVAENDTVTLEVSATTVPLSILYTLGFQWQKFDGSGFVNIPGQTQPAYVFDAALADHGAQYRVIVSIPGTNVAYTTALAVTADSSPPRLIAASSLDGMSIGVCFSERVTAATAGDNFNYTVNGGANQVLVAQARPDGRSALLFLDSPVSGSFTVEASSIEDSAGGLGGGTTNGIVQDFMPFDVGAPTAVGSSFSCVPGEIDVIAGGADIWAASDQGHLTLTPRYGDFDIHTRVHSLTRVDAIAKAGLMVRENTNANSRVLHNLLNPPVTLAGRDLGEAGLRPNPGAATALVPGSSSYYPVGIPDAWVRIKRTGSLYITYRGWDGVNWIEIGRVNLGFPDPVLIGLATTAHNNAAPATLAEYRDVYIPRTPIILVQPSPASQTVLVNGSVTYSVVASNPPNSGPLVYQWKKDGASIPGATSSTFTLNGVQDGQAGVYTVWVGNDGGATISSAVELLVDNLPPLVGNDSLSTPQDVPLNTPVGTLLANDSDLDGGTVSIVAVSGLHPISYASDFNSGLPAGATIFGTATVEVGGGADGSGHIRLNPALANQAGSLILNEMTPRRRVSAFVASFKLRIAEGSTEPADGFSFNFGPDLTIGTSTGAEGGVGTGLSLCVDNFRFAPIPLGGTANTSGVKLRYGGGDVAYMRTPTWDRDAWVPITVSVTAEGKVNVLINGTNVFGELSIPWVPRTGRFGFYARTGGQFESHGIDDLSIATVLTVETVREANLGAEIFGNAYVDNGFLHLTDSAISLSGSFLPNELTPGVPVTSFTANFNLRIGNGSAEPADGFSFNFANDLPIGATTPAAAENGGGTGFSFCVDNYRFAPYPAGGTLNTSGMKIRYGGVDIAGVQIPTWNNAAFIPVSITLASDGALTVLVNGTNVFGALVLPWTPTIGRFGLYGRTGGQNQTHWIDDLAINVTTAGSPGSFAANFNSGGFGKVVLNGGVVTYSPPAGGCGTDTYYYLASDGGGIAIGTVNVNIMESTPTPPVIVTCPPNRAFAPETGTQVALPDMTGEVVATDNCLSVTITQSPAPGTLVGPGQTTVTFTATDSGGLTANCQAVVTVVVPVQLTGASYTGGNFSASFQTATGFNYTVEYKNNLNDPLWTTLTVIAGDGTLKSFTDIGPLPPMRFYRVSADQ
jgi:uncharacterized repeat protein (TIGR01451 family)